jgi:hypothetical protein
MLEDELAGLGGKQGARGVAEQVHAERRLDRAQALAQQLGRQAERACGAGDVTGRQHRQEVEQA